MPVGIIRPEAAINIRRKYVAKFRVFYPLTVGSEVLVKIVVRNIRVIVLRMRLVGR